MTHSCSHTHIYTQVLIFTLIFLCHSFIQWHICTHSQPLLHSHAESHVPPCTLSYTITQLLSYSHMLPSVSTLIDHCIHSYACSHTPTIFRASSNTMPNTNTHVFTQSHAHLQSHTLTIAHYTLILTLMHWHVVTHTPLIHTHSHASTSTHSTYTLAQPHTLIIIHSHIKAHSCTLSLKPSMHLHSPHTYYHKKHTLLPSYPTSLTLTFTYCKKHTDTITLTFSLPHYHTHANTHIYIYTQHSDWTLLMLTLKKSISQKCWASGSRCSPNFIAQYH
jgi:hypothetical protein